MLIAKITPLNIKVASWISKGSWAILDQGLFAGGNFLVNILLARWLPITEYGAFAVTYSIFMLLASVHSAFFTEPMLVFGQIRYRKYFSEYLGHIILFHFVVMMLIGVALLGVSKFLEWKNIYLISNATKGFAFSSLGILLLWILRRASYSQFHPQWAAIGGGIYLLLVIGLMCLLHNFHAISLTLGIAVMGIASIIASLVLIFIQKPKWGLYDKSMQLQIIQDHWYYGKWAGAKALFMWIPNNIYYSIMPVTMGIVESANLRAYINLVVPIQNVFSAISVLLIPVFGRSLKEVGLKKTIKISWLITLIQFLFGIIYSISLLIFADKLFGLLYTDKFEISYTIIVLVSILPLASVVSSVFGGILRAAERPNLVFWTYVYSSIVTITVGVYLSINGVAMAILGLIISSVVTSVMTIFFINRLRRSNNSKLQTDLLR